MAVRTSLLNGNNIARDTDFSKYIETVSEPGVIEGLTVTSTKVAIGKARVPCLRTNGETIFALVTVTSEVTISGNGDVFIEVSQTYIDNGELANEDGTGIATIQVGTMPAENALKLATISNGVVTDARNMIAKVGELKTYIQSLNTRMNTAEQKIDQIIENKAVDHLEETGLVGEKYTLANTLFKQLTPTFANASVDNNIGDVAANTAIHIQRLGSGTASNKLKLKAKKIGAPTTGLVVEVRRGVQVDVSTTEAYWYGNELVCSGSIPYSSFSTDYQEFEITMNGQFGGTKGEKLDIVVYQTGSIVNSTNYYAIACDSTQYSEGFSYVAYDGSTYTRSKLMPYCIADGFAQSMLCKYETASISMTTLESKNVSISKTSSSGTDTTTYTFSASYSKVYAIVSGSAYASQNGEWSVTISLNGTSIWSQSASRPNGSTTVAHTEELTCNAGDIITIDIYVRDWGGSSASFSGTTKISGESSAGGNRLLIAEEIYEIGTQGAATSYGRLQDGSRYGEFYQTVSSSATTGNIALGNCVGFLPIKAKDGTVYKIPIYGA